MLGFQWVDRSATLMGEAYAVPTPFSQFADGDRLSFCNTLNGKIYAAESPDAIRASDSQGATLLRYTENNIPAAIASDRGYYRTVVLGFPFEVISTESQRDQFMQRVMQFLDK